MMKIDLRANDGCEVTPGGARATTELYKNLSMGTTPSTEVAFTNIQRMSVVVHGIVQGVGFRPFVYSQARRWELGGFVRNDSTGVTIEIEGSQAHLANFLRALQEETPVLARVDAVEVRSLAVRGETSFVIERSQTGTERRTLISPDTAVCAGCLREMNDPADRRYHYPFINCTNCGPRFTIIEDVPYDREKTTMRVFPMCSDCQREYEDPLNRRFHAQPNACPVCGPQVFFQDWSEPYESRDGVSLPCRDGQEALPAPISGTRSSSDTGDAITAAAQVLNNGSILAVKGLGGYHLACDALQDGAVTRLRQRKHREARPFALMVPDLSTARLLCQVSEQEAELLQSYRRPIVLLKRRAICPVADSVAPGCDTLGMMLPYTPLHYVLLQRCAEMQEKKQSVVLVMTSGNVSDEPIVYRDEDVAQRLGMLADGVLTHNREIQVRCDDLVLRVTKEGPQFLRRSRGYVPEPLVLAWDFPVPLLAAGAHLKNTFCLGKGRQAFVSQHLGDLENLETLLAYRVGVEHFQRIFDIQPEAVAFDLHPEYLATKEALESSIPCKIGVQHHHAHIASVMVEHGLRSPVIGIAADGTGYGTDGEIWGGEILVSDLRGFTRSFHLRYVPLPGGEQAVKQPWRMGAAYLQQAYGQDFLELEIPFVQRLDRQKWRVLAQMIERGLGCPQTSSMGRLFDAVAALLGLRAEVQYEGQAAIELEMEARQAQHGLLMGVTPGGYPFELNAQLGTMDVLPMMRAIVRNVTEKQAVPLIAWRFHMAIAEMLAEACLVVRQQTGLTTVALSGGVFQNRLLLELVTTRLEEQGFQVYTNRLVPPNDGGISLGQAAIAAARLQ